ncbi:hypothetical protein HanPSC8_Chr01g0008921 [Helianthus annuus]|nr:hypothetical protein HanPSC8_Chr01g0008921 [Helianthus annuus]
MFTRHEWYFTPPHHASPQQQQQQQQDPSEDPRFVAVTPPPPPPPVQPAPPQPPRRRRTGARISVRTGDFHFSSPLQSSGSHYPPHQEDPQMGGPSRPVAPQPPPMVLITQFRHTRVPWRITRLSSQCTPTTTTPKPIRTWWRLTITPKDHMETHGE